jgi:PPM family protein phosphatase
MQDTVEKALIETIKQHPEFIEILNTILIENTENVNQNSFTRQNNARKSITNKQPIDFFKYIIESVTNEYVAANMYYYNELKNYPEKERLKRRNELFPFYQETEKSYNIITNPEINIVAYYKANYNELLLLTNIVQNKIRRALKFPDLNNRINEFYPADVEKKINTDITAYNRVNNLNIYNKTLNKCLLDIINGEQLENRHNEYNYDGTLYATQDVGKRNNQEDSVAILAHPLNKNIRLIAVSDGMGGVDYGEIASSYTILEITKWFNSIPLELFYDSNKLAAEFNKTINDISNDIYNKYNSDGKARSGATFTGAIIGPRETLIASIGDSRAYIVDGGKTSLVTNDESFVWNQNPRVLFSDDKIDNLKFQNNNNIILRYIGSKDVGKAQMYIADNNEYERLLITSDGVTDLLSENQIKFISKEYPKEQVTQILIAAAVNNDHIRKINNQNMIIQAGKDNASAALYARR